MSPRTYLATLGIIQVASFIDFYNTERPKERLGGLSPVEYRIGQGRNCLNSALYASTAFQPPSVRVAESKFAPTLTSFLGLPSAPTDTS